MIKIHQVPGEAGQTHGKESPRLQNVSHVHPGLTLAHTAPQGHFWETVSWARQSFSLTQHGYFYVFFPKSCNLLGNN